MMAVREKEDKENNLFLIKLLNLFQPIKNSI